MKRTKYQLTTGIDLLRSAVRDFRNCNETFLQQFTPLELLRIHEAWMMSPWDFYPDSWSRQQVADALCRVAPNWNDDEEPTQGIPFEECP